jgi:hypothetical protein
MSEMPLALITFFVGVAVGIAVTIYAMIKAEIGPKF